MTTFRLSGLIITINRKKHFFRNRNNFIWNSAGREMFIIGFVPALAKPSV